MRVDDFAKLDLDREDRTGTPEIVLADAKTDAELRAICQTLAAAAPRGMVSRLQAGRRHVLEGIAHTYHERARIAVLAEGRAPRRGGRVAVVAAGTADISVAEEARVVADELGADVDAFYDVGVAGLHRLLDVVPGIRRADAVVACAGREGALPTVLAGLVPAPVVAVPVSVGYGAGGRGEAALHAALQSCSPLAVVNIDAGVVAGAIAARIANQSAAAALRRGAAPLRLREIPAESRSRTTAASTTRPERNLNAR